MGLSPIANPAHKTIRGVRFAMLDGVELVTVLVTHAALEAIEAPQPAKDACLDRFEMHRAKSNRLRAASISAGRWR